MKQQIADLINKKRSEAMTKLFETNKTDTERVRFFEGKLKALDQIALDIYDIVA